MNCGLNKAQLDALRKIREIKGEEEFKRVCEKIGYNPEIFNFDNLSHVSNVAQEPSLNVSVHSFHDGSIDKEVDETEKISSYFSTKRLHQKTIKAFNREVLSETLIDVSGDFSFKSPSSYNFEHGTTNINHNISAYKIKMVNKLLSLIGSDKIYFISDIDSKEEKESKFKFALETFWSIRLSLSKELYDTAIEYYVKLKYFDTLINSLGYIQIDSRYNGTNNNFDNKYIYDPTSVKLDSGFSTEEHSDAIKASSTMSKMILNNIPEVDLNGKIKPNSSVGIAGFNYVMQRLKEWINSYHNNETQRLINEELRKGANKDLNKLIQLWIDSDQSKINPLMVDKLNAIKNIIFGKKDGKFILSSDLRVLFTNMYDKFVSARYVQYADDEDDVKPSMLWENVINISKYHLVDNLTGASVYWSINKNEFNRLKESYKKNEISIYEYINKLLWLNIDESFDEYNRRTDNTKSSVDILQGIVTILEESLSEKSISDIDKFLSTTYKNINNSKSLFNQTILLSASKVLSSLKSEEGKSVIQNNEGNNLPLTQLRSLAYLHKDVVKRINSQTEDGEFFHPYSTNICYSNVDNIEQPLIRSDISSNGKTKPITKANFSELMELTIVDDFLYNLQNKNAEGKNIIGMQTDCFADKSRYFVTQFNLSTNWKFFDEEKGDFANVNLLHLLEAASVGNSDSIQSLLNIWRSSWHSELENKFLKIKEDYAKVFPELRNGDELKDDDFFINFVTKYFENHTTEDLIKKFNTAGINIKCVEEIHYSGNGLNKTLLYLRDITGDQSEFTKYFKTRLNAFVDRLSDGKEYSAWSYISERSLMVKDLSPDWIIDSSESVLHTIRVTDEETGETRIVNKKVKRAKIKNGTKINPKIISYFLAHNILAQSYNRLMFGDFWAHPNKSKQEDDQDKSLESRWQGQTKRLVIAGATYHMLAQDLTYGVPRQVNIAAINDHVAYVHNTTGDEIKVDSADGSGYVIPYYSEMENASLVDAPAGRNKKTIFHDIDIHGNATLLKWAEYSLSNEKRRESQRSRISADKMFKKMCNIPFDEGAKQRILSSFRYPSQSISYYNNEKSRHINIISATMAIVNGGLVLNMITNDIENRFVSYPINSIYDIDQAFGGCWCSKLNNSTGEYEWSDDNIKVVTKIICDCGIKDYMIHYVVNKSAIKVGTSNLNSSKRFVDDEAFMTFKMSTEFGGLQMDADHTTEESQSTEPTQMLSALAQNGYSQEKIEDAYDNISSLIMDSISDYTQALSSGNIDELYKIVEKSVIDSFEKGDREVIGLAQEFIAIAKKYGESKGYKIPFSSSSINGIFTSTIMSDLTKKGIRRKYPGQGGVINPSYDMMCYYEVNGSKLKYSQLLPILYKTANDLSIAKPLDGRSVIDVLFENVEIKLSNGETILNPFKSELVTSLNPVEFEGTYIIHNQPSILGSITLEDGTQEIIYEFDEYGNYIYIDPKGNKTIKKYDTINIRTMDDFLFYRNNPNVVLYKDSLSAINLRGADVKYTVSTDYGDVIISQQENPFSIAMYLLKNDKVDTFVPVNDIQRVAIELINQGSDLNSLNKKIKHLRKLQQKFLFDVKESHDFFGIGIVKNVEMKPAEIMMGRLYAKQLGIRMTDNISDITSPEFFKNRLSNYYRIDNIDKESYDFVLFDGSGKKLYIKVGNVDVFNVKPNDDYETINGQIYNNGKKICSSEGKNFYKLTTSDGNIVDLCSINSIDRLNEIINVSHWNNIIRNYTRDNIEYMFKYKLDHEWSDEYLDKKGYKTRRLWYLDDSGKITFSDGWNPLIMDKGSDNVIKMLNEDSLIALNININKICEQKFNAFKKSLLYIGTRIPCQSMSSFSPMEIVLFADTDINETYLPASIMQISGGDFDIDKEYIIVYSILEDGTMPNSLSNENKYKNEVYYKNNIIESILSIVMDHKHIINLTTPVSVDTLKSISKNREAGQGLLDPSIPSSQYIMQIENAVGKSSIGVAATGVKGMFNLTYNYNDNWSTICHMCKTGDTAEFDEAYRMALRMSTKSLLDGSTNGTLTDVNLMMFDEDVMQRIKDNHRELYDLIDIIKRHNDERSDISLSSGELLNAATDNAKELILKKINADESFMDIYISGLCIGLNLVDIARIMTSQDVNNLIRQGEANIFSTQFRPTYKTILDGNLGRTRFYSGPKIKITNEIQSFDKLVSLSEELNMLGKLTSINQGIKTSKSDLYNWIQNINEYFIKKDIPFDLIRFFSDEEFANIMINAYEDQKVQFNILESIYRNPLMKSLYNVLVTAVNISNSLSVLNKVEYELSRNEDYDMMKNDLSLLCDLTWVGTLENPIRFIIPKNTKISTGHGDISLPMNKEFVITASKNLDSSNITFFKDYMNFHVIPTLKSLYPNNKFIQDLIFGITKFNGKNSIYYRLPINMMETSSSDAIATLYDEYSSAFKDLYWIKIGDNRVIDLLYIYNLFVNKTFSQSSFTKLFADLESDGYENTLSLNHNHWIDSQNPDTIIKMYMESVVFTKDDDTKENKISTNPSQVYSLSIPKSILLDSIFDDPKSWGANIDHVHRVTDKTIYEVMAQYGLNKNFVTSHNMDIAKAYVFNGEIFINTDRASESDLVHELSHWLIALIKQSDGGYNRLRHIYEELSKTDKFNELKDNYAYKDLNNDDFNEEVLAHLIADDLSWIEKLGIKIPNNSTYEFVKMMLDPSSEIRITPEEFVKIKKSQQVVTFRNDLIKNNKIIEDCK